MCHAALFAFLFQTLGLGFLGRGAGMPTGWMARSIPAHGEKLPSSPAGSNTTFPTLVLRLASCFFPSGSGEVSRAQCMQAEVAAKLRDYENY